MAKHSILGLIRGKVGNMVGQSNSLSNGKDKQVWRAYNGAVANPKTNKQAQQRSLFVAAKNFQTAFAGILDHSWQGIAYGPKSLNFFRKQILTAGGANYPTFAYQAKGTMTPVPQPWPVSKGSINVQGFDNIALSTTGNYYSVGAYNITEPAPSLASYIPGLQIGDQVTLVALKANTAIITTGGSPISQSAILSSEYVPVVGRFIVDNSEVDVDSTIDFTDENGNSIGYMLYLEQNFLEIVKTDYGKTDLAAVALIVSRKVEGKASWQRSTAVMFVPDFITEAFNSADYVQSCIASFQDAAGNQESDWYLNEPTDDTATADPGYIKASTLQTEGQTPETLTNAAITVRNFGNYFAGCILYDSNTRKYYMFTSPNTLALSASALSQQAITDGVDGYNWLDVDINVVVELSRLGYIIQDHDIRPVPPIPPVIQFVDLGLPSGKLWAKMNIGATSEEEAGLYISWGNVQGVAGDDAAGIAAMTEAAYASTSGASLETDIPATAANDAAVANIGGNWRMPTQAEFLELHTNCDWTWKQVNGVNGYEVKSKAAGNTNSIFLPAAGYIDNGTLDSVGAYGYYWSSSVEGGDEGYACDLNFNSGDVYPEHSDDRYYGCSVRPVQNAPSA